MPARSDTRKHKAPKKADAQSSEVPKRGTSQKTKAAPPKQSGSAVKSPRASASKPIAAAPKVVEHKKAARSSLKIVGPAPAPRIDVRLRPRKVKLDTSGVRAMSGVEPASKQPGEITIRTSVPNGAGRSSAKRGDVASQAAYRPSEAEPFMNERQRNYFRNKLVAWKEEILRQNQETLQGLHEDSAQFPDVADRATSETDRALELRARDRQRKLMAKIDAALARIEEGTYGYCEETGEPISLKRLDARPIATMSLEAQERKERMERVFRED